ncbi:MAG TPA: hypothetical protein VK966_13170 [Longimicrobiales bacterium]|nr:hypothetical protein [Longimicrobiales bacterium]
MHPSANTAPTREARDQFTRAAALTRNERERAVMLRRAAGEESAG